MICLHLTTLDVSMGDRGILLPVTAILNLHIWTGMMPDVRGEDFKKNLVNSNYFNLNAYLFHLEKTSENSYK